MLCTHSKTFAVQQVETSNSLFLLPVIDRRPSDDVAPGADAGSTTASESGAEGDESSAPHRTLLVIEGAVASHLEVVCPRTLSRAYCARHPPQRMSHPFSRPLSGIISRASHRKVTGPAAGTARCRYRVAGGLAAIVGLSLHVVVDLVPTSSCRRHCTTEQTRETTMMVPAVRVQSGRRNGYGDHRCDMCRSKRSML